MFRLVPMLPSCFSKCYLANLSKLVHVSETQEGSTGLKLNIQESQLDAFESVWYSYLVHTLNNYQA